jgi:hypothetical protein
MAQTAGRGTSWVSVVLGWLAALGAALILSSIVGAIVGAIFAALGAKSGTTGGGISGLIGLLLTLLIAFYLGGYAAGRMASRSGVKHGLGGPAGFSGNDCTGAHRSGGGRQFHRPAWRHNTARSGREGCTECPATRVEHHPLGLWDPCPVVPVHRRSTRGCTWGQSRTRAPLPILNKGHSRFGSRLETLAALARSYPYQTKLAEAGSLPAPKSLLFLLTV